MRYGKYGWVVNYLVNYLGVLYYLYVFEYRRFMLMVVLFKFVLDILVFIDFSSCYEFVFLNIVFIFLILK